MTAAPSIVGVAPIRRRRSHQTLFALALPLVVVAGLVFGCTSTPATPGPSDQGAATPVGPVGTGPTPKPTSWPSQTVAAAVALGAADGQFESMGNDLTSAVNAGDLQALLRVTDGSLTFLKGNQQNIPHLQAYAETKPLGDALAKAYADMIAGLQQIHDSLVSGNSSGVQSGFQQFAVGSQEYGAVRQDLADKSEQAIFMTRILNR